LKAAGISNLAALDAVAAAMRSVVVKPTVKGEVSGRLATLLDEPYLRFCRPCDTIHLYEMPFRLAAVRAGLELRPGTSPPVLARIPGFKPATKTAGAKAAGAEAAGADPADRFDLVRAYLRLLGPATPKHVADYVDAPVKDVKARWPADAVEVSVGGQTRWVLADDEAALKAERPHLTRLLGPFDLYLQAKDRPLLIDDADRAKALWPVLGRPGAVLVDGDVAGTWRPRKSGQKLALQVDLWTKVPAARRKEIEEQAQRLAAYRGVALTGITTG
jgi:hypothetical protein